MPDIEKTLSAWVIKEQKKGSPITDEAIREQAYYFASIPGPENPALNPVNNPGWLEKFKQKHHVHGGAKGTSRKDSVADPDNMSNATSSRQSPSLGISPASPDDMTLSSSSPNDDSIFKSESVDDMGGVRRRKSPPVIDTVFSEMGSSSACFTPNILSPTSPFFSPDSTSQSLHSPGISQTFPTLDHYMTSSPNAPDTLQSPRFLPSLSSTDEPQLESIDEAMEDAKTIDPVTLMPSVTMETSCGFDASNLPRQQKPSQDEAREALKTVLDFFETQPNGSLDLQEGVLLGRLVEKLQLKNGEGR